MGWMEKYQQTVRTALVLNLVFCALLLQQLFFVAKQESKNENGRFKNYTSTGRTKTPRTGLKRNDKTESLDQNYSPTILSVPVPVAVAVTIPVAVSVPAPLAQAPVPTPPAPESLQRLRDVLIPFTAGQIDRVFDHLESWRGSQPCPTVPPTGPLPKGYEFYMTNPNVGRNITLTLALSGMEDPGIRKKLLDQFHSLPVVTTQCFREARVVFANLTGDEDSYLQGARNMVEAMMRNDFRLNSPYYVLYLEPDCRPLKRYWLSALDAMTRPPTADFWIKGSLYRGKSRGVIDTEVYARHLNGNAIYRVGDAEFLRFHFKQVVPHPGSKSGYDTDRYQYFVDKRDKVLEVRHKFVYSDFIQNMWHYEYSPSQLLIDSPYTFLTHGGHPK